MVGSLLADLARELTELDIKVLMLDGEHLATGAWSSRWPSPRMGPRCPPGLWEGSTKNKTVVGSLLADLLARGLSAEDELLVVMDGARALAAAVREVFGAKAVVQRYTLHKRRNVADHLPAKEKEWVDAKLVKALTHPDPEQGLHNARHLAELRHRQLGKSAVDMTERSSVSPFSNRQK